jgi:hypothetical protein
MAVSGGQHQCMYVWREYVDGCHVGGDWASMCRDEGGGCSQPDRKVRARGWMHPCRIASAICDEWLG